MLKILVAHNRYRSASPSGEDRVVDQEHDALEAAGHEVHRFERFSDDIARLSFLERAAVPGRVIWSRRSGREFGEELRRLHPDVVHVHNLFPLISPSVLRSCQDHGVPSVVTFHNYRLVCASGNLFRSGAVCRACVGRLIPTPAVAHGCYRGSALATLPLALGAMAHRALWQTAPSAYIFLSDAQRREFEPADLPIERCFVKHNFVVPMPDEPARGPLVVYLGRLTEDKGLRQLMRAWDRYTAVQTTSELTLAIAGSGPLDTEVRGWAHVRPSVSVLGLLDHQQCAALASRARAVIVPSEWPEPFGLVVAEAMAAGVAPIATDHGAFADLITDGVDGLLYPAGDVDALARLLRLAEEAPEWINELGLTARETYRQKFDPARNVAELEKIYRFVLAHPRQPGAPGDGSARAGAPKAGTEPSLEHLITEEDIPRDVGD